MELLKMHVRKLATRSEVHPLRGGKSTSAGAPHRGDRAKGGDAPASFGDNTTTSPEAVGNLQR